MQFSAIKYNWHFQNFKSLFLCARHPGVILIMDVKITLKIITNTIISVKLPSRWFILSMTELAWEFSRRYEEHTGQSLS